MLPRSLAALSLLLLTTCQWSDVMPHQRLIPEAFPISKLEYHNRESNGCTISVYRLDDTYRKQFGANSFRELRKAQCIKLSQYQNGTAEKGSHQQCKYGNWKRTPIEPHVGKATSSISILASRAMSCLSASARYYKIFIDSYYTDWSSYFTQSKQGFDLLLFVPAKNVVFVVPS